MYYPAAGGRRGVPGRLPGVVSLGRAARPCDLVSGTMKSRIASSFFCYSRVRAAEMNSSYI